MIYLSVVSPGVRGGVKDRGGDGGAGGMRWSNVVRSCFGRKDRGKTSDWNCTHVTRL